MPELEPHLLHSLPQLEPAQVSDPAAHHPVAPVPFTEAAWPHPADPVPVFAGSYGGLQEAGLQDALQQLVDFDGTECARIFFPSPSGLPGYKERIAKPMSLSQIQSKLRKGGYTAAKFAADMALIYSNCLTFNGAGTVYAESAHKLSCLAERLIPGGAYVTPGTAAPRAVAPQPAFMPSPVAVAYAAEAAQPAAPQPGGSDGEQDPEKRAAKAAKKAKKRAARALQAAIDGTDPAALCAAMGEAKTQGVDAALLATAGERVNALFALGA